MFLLDKEGHYIPTPSVCSACVCNCGSPCKQAREEIGQPFTLRFNRPEYYAADNKDTRQLAKRNRLLNRN